MWSSALAAAALASGSPGLCNDLDETAMEADQAGRPRRGGYEIVQGAGGFALVTHGLWAQTELSTALPVKNTAPTVRQPKLYSAAARIDMSANNFRRAAFLPHVQAAEHRFGLPTGLLDALVWTESRYNPVAVSPVGAAGLGQLMPGTARELGVTNRFDPLANISGAARYLRQMLDKFGLVHLAIAAYNAGPGAVERARGIPRNGETPAYVSNVLAYWGFR